MLSVRNFILLFGITVTSQSFAQTEIKINHVGVQKVEENTNSGRFYFNTQTDVLFCQIDGDQASGFNKFGYFLGVNTGYKLKNSSWNAIEMRMGIAERGSRRAPSNIDPSITPFNIRINTIDVNLGATKKWNFSGMQNPIALYAGIKSSRVFAAKETEMYMPSIDQDLRKMNYMLDLAARYPLSDHMNLQVSYIYSLKSITWSGSTNMYFGRGTYHNNFAVGILYIP